MRNKISECFCLCFAITAFILNSTLTIHFWLTTGCQIQENKSTKARTFEKEARRKFSSGNILKKNFIKKDYHDLFLTKQPEDCNVENDDEYHPQS